MRRAVFNSALALAALIALAMGGGTALAKKSSKPGGVKTRTATASATGHAQIATATATCPKKTKAVGGGFSETPVSPSGTAGVVYESQKVSQRAWRVSTQVLDSGPPDTVSLTTFVYCRKNVKATGTVTASVPKPAVAQIGPAVLATCTGKKNAMAGGFATGPPATGAATASDIVIDSVRTTDKIWQSQVASGTSAANTVSSFAYCATGKAPKVASATGPPVGPAGTTSTAIATCSGKSKMVVGGFSQVGTTVGPPGGFFIPTESLRTGGKTWQVSGFKSGVAPVSLTSQGLCAR